MLSVAAPPKQSVSSHVHGPGCRHSGDRESAATLVEVDPHDEVSVAAGVVDMRSTQAKRAFPISQAAMWSLDAAIQAASNGTFGVGGALLGPHRELLAVSCNRVLDQGQVADPTAHGERQLVDWYFERLHQGDQLPPPQQCLIVSSLDPCMMCAGSILGSGFQVVSTTLDTTAGVNCSADQTYSTLPAQLREQAQQQFSYFGVEGRREFRGPLLYGEQASLDASVEDRSLGIFLESLEQVKAAVHSGSAAGEAPLQDLSLGQAPQSVVATLKAHSPHALSYKCAPGTPDRGLAPLLIEFAKQAANQGAPSDAAALIDPHGNLVLACSSAQNISPSRTPLMELSRAWAHIRAEAGPEAAQWLAPFKDCTLVTLYGPGADAAGVTDLGGYGSSVEGPTPQRPQAGWQYVLPRQSQRALEQELQHLPPLYSKIICPRIEQVSCPDLVAEVEDALGGSRVAL